MNSIFDIREWEANKVYYTNDIMTDSGFFYYSLKDHSSSVVNFENFGGVLTIGQTTLPSFIWKPSYGSQVKMEPPIKSVKFGDGYEQRYKTNIENSLYEFDLKFEARNDNEALAIYHFLYSKEEKYLFFWQMPDPLNMIKTFLAKELSLVRNFNGNNSISVKFIQKPFHETLI